MTAPHPRDGCGECLTAEDSIIVRPYRVRPDGTGEGIVAWYRCPRCGHSWWTSWGLAGLEALEAKDGAA